MPGPRNTKYQGSNQPHNILVILPLLRSAPLSHGERSRRLNDLQGLSCFLLLLLYRPGPPVCGREPSGPPPPVPAILSFPGSARRFSPSQNGTANGPVLESPPHESVA